MEIIVLNSGREKTLKESRLEKSNSTSPLSSVLESKPVGKQGASSLFVCRILFPSVGIMVV